MLYSEGYQTILNVGDEKSRVVTYGNTKPTNLDFRNNLIKSLKIPNVPNEELKTNGNLVWWEKELDRMASNKFNE